MGHGGRRFRIGLFVLGAGGLFVALLGFVASSGLSTERAVYHILFAENVKGMVVGSRVNFQGVPIGVVGDIRFQDGKTLVELRVDPTRCCIQHETTARLDRLLVTGQVTIELEGYGQHGKALAPGSFIEPKEDPMHALTASIPEVVDRAADVLARLDSMLARTERLLDDHNLTKVAAILDDLAGAAADLRSSTVPEATALLRDGRAATAHWGQLPAEMQPLLHEATALAQSLRGPTQQALASLRQALDDVRALARQLKLAPDSMLFGVQHPAVPNGGER
jgi:ABC-type transporter Mla subunit MlaD